MYFNAGLFCPSWGTVCIRDHHAKKNCQDKNFGLISIVFFSSISDGVCFLPFLDWRSSTGVFIVLSAGSEIKANLQFYIFSFSPFVAFTGGAPWVQIWLPPKSGDNRQGCAIEFPQLQHCVNIGAEKSHKLRYFRSRPNTSGPQLDNKV